ncbi:hypothetical protein Y032_0178g673 [Ancylostoma ceylanicum]|uniref:Uncharacterized protein n=1 Tax=Ancylostoma ceylanicum TaxID=53326 RepID=A0A016STZ9_9BILA|nr:hypothetical protein Y032_0178g673 [Ancylostoma ceylanicum]
MVQSRNPSIFLRRTDASRFLDECIWCSCCHKDSHVGKPGYAFRPQAEVILSGIAKCRHKRIVAFTAPPRSRYKSVTFMGDMLDRGDWY